MSAKKLAVDVRGVPLAVGDTVEVRHIPAWLLSGLPIADQTAIRNLVGQRAPIVAFDGVGNAEIEFAEPKDAPRTIWIDPDCLLKIA